MTQPALSVLIAWCNRPELSRTLRENSPHFRSHNAEVLVLNSGGDISELNRLVAESGLESAKPIHLGHSVFNKSRALNAGIFMSRSPYIFALDSDIVLRGDFIGEASTHLDGKHFITVKALQETALDPYMEWTTKTYSRAVDRTRLTAIDRSTFLTMTFADGTQISHETLRLNLFDGSKLGCGQLLAEKDHLIQIGGYNSMIDSWGWEDNDVKIRLAHVLKLQHLELGSALHLSHPDSSRALFGKNMYESNAGNGAKVCALYAQGQFLGTYQQDCEPLKGMLASR